MKGDAWMPRLMRGIVGARTEVLGQPVHCAWTAQGWEGVVAQGGGAHEGLPWCKVEKAMTTAMGVRWTGQGIIPGGVNGDLMLGVCYCCRL